MTQINVAVTGVGNPLGQNILKALRMSALPLRLFALDAHPFSAGFYGADVAVLCPRADAPDYVDELIAFLRANNIAIMFFGTEAEPAKLVPHKIRIEVETGTVLMIADSALLTIADDKYNTALALAHAGLDHPASAPADDNVAVDQLVQRVGYPLIAKPRRGSASRGLARIAEPRQLAAQLREGMVIQECLLPDDAEYTVGIYRSRDGRTIASTVIHRDLDFGLTYRGRIGPHPDIAEYASQVVEAVSGFGSINVQLRLTGRGPVCFEINPRFSSTTPVRAHFGVNEPELAIREYVLRDTLDTVVGRAGSVMREWHEVYLEENETAHASMRDLSVWRGA